MDGHADVTEEDLNNGGEEELDDNGNGGNEGGDELSSEGKSEENAADQADHAVELARRRSPDESYHSYSSPRSGDLEASLDQGLLASSSGELDVANVGGLSVGVTKRKGNY
jgi:hypothetical protein